MSPKRDCGTTLFRYSWLRVCGRARCVECACVRGGWRTSVLAEAIMTWHRYTPLFVYTQVYIYIYIRQSVSLLICPASVWLVLSRVGAAQEPAMIYNSPIFPVLGSVTTQIPHSSSAHPQIDRCPSFQWNFFGSSLYVSPIIKGRLCCVTNYYLILGIVFPFFVLFCFFTTPDA